MTENELTLERVHNAVMISSDGVNKNYVALIPLGAEVTNFEAISGNFQRMYENGLKDGANIGLMKKLIHSCKFLDEYLMQSLQK